MVKIGRKSVISMIVLCFSFIVPSFNSFAETTPQAKIKIVNTLKQQKDSDKKNILSTQELSAIQPKVISVEVNVDKEQKSYIVKCIGTIKNNSNLLLKNIKINVQLMNTDKNIVEETSVENIERLESGQEKSFKIEKFVNTKESPFDLRAMAKIISLEKTNFIEIAQWFLEAKKDNIIAWNIPYSEQDFMNESTLRNASIRILLDVPENDKNYNKALDIINELRYTEGISALELSDFENGFINLCAVHPSRKFGDKAAQALLTFRTRMVMEKAKSLTLNRDYQRASNLLRSISPQNKSYENVQKELNKLSFLIRTVKSSPTPDLSNYTPEQQKVIMLMEEKPQYILINAPFKNISTWVYPDFSRFLFDSNGELVGYKIYPLY